MISKSILRPTDQVYMIKRINNNLLSNYLYGDTIFTSYAESRKAAKQMIEEINMQVGKKRNFEGNTINVNQMIEFSPDIWSNGEVTISIIAFETKNMVLETRNLKRGRKPLRSDKQSIIQHSFSEALPELAFRN